MKAHITDQIQGITESVDGSARAYSVSVDYLVIVKPFTVEPRNNENGFIEHFANVDVVVKVVSRPAWDEIKFNDTEEFINKRNEDLREAPDVAGSAADYADEQDAKSAVAQVWAVHDSAEQRKRVIERFFKEGGAQ